jgi:hypothetical protein
MIAAVLAACTPTDDGSTTTTTVPSGPTTTIAPGTTTTVVSGTTTTVVSGTTTTVVSSGPAPTITDAEYGQSSIKLWFTPPAEPAGQVVTNYIYDLSCTGVTTVTTSGQYLGTVASPASVGTTCPDGTPSTYRLTAVIGGSTLSATSAWRTVDALTAPTLTDAQYATSSVALHFTAPTVAADQSVSNYVYALSCDGGHTVEASRNYLATTVSPAAAGSTCAESGTPSTYRIAEIIDGSWTSPYTAWRTADALVAPTLTGATVHSVGATLSFSPPAVGSDQSVSNYVYDLSCDGGATVQTAASYVGTTSSPASVGYRCASPASSSYRLAAILNGTWTTPYTAWTTAS